MKITDVNNRKVVAKGVLDTQGIKFGDICFADEMLVYSVVGKGIFGMLVKEAIGVIPEQELLHECQILLPIQKADRFFLGWANGTKRLMAVATDEHTELNHFYSINLYTKEQRSIEVALDWIYESQNYSVTSNQLKGFGVSDDGEYIAFSGVSLMVFHKEGEYYGLSRKPIKAKISCSGADFSECMGISSEDKEFLEQRGANFG